ncbi:MAG: LTA synthase family protein [Myxococcota bacterium]|nr:LTA synthase family protein [Myxococcota bacterium]
MNVPETWTFRKKIRHALGPTFALWLAFVMLRLQMVLDLKLTLEQAIQTNIVIGMAYDLLIALIPLFIAQLFNTILHCRLTWPWSTAAFVLWVCTLANTLHMRFFQTPLDWWIVQMHWQDLFVVHDSASDLGLTTSIIASIAALLCAVALAVFLFKGMPVTTNGNLFTFTPPKRQQLYQCLYLFLILGMGWQANHWASSHKGGTLLSNHIVRSWALQIFRQRMYVGRSLDWTQSLGSMVKDGRNPAALLAAYRDYPEPPSPENQTQWPLVKTLQQHPTQTYQLRKQLGLPLDGPIHLIFLFLESFRAYEFQKPEIATHIFPELRAIVDKHGIEFNQTYSSSYKAGQTVRGQFSTLCSMLPNTMGAATYMAHTLLRVRCLAEVAKENDYQTMWMNSYKSNYHSKKSFEVMHGTDVFYDGDYFRAQGIVQKTSKWGLADKPVLQEALRVLEKSGHSHKPIFANILTISSHHPFTEIAEAQLDKSLPLYQNGSESYRGYLSTLSYGQAAAADFLQGLFDGPLGKRTLVAMLGDHSTTVLPGENLSYAQKRELRFRIPFALLTKEMPNPQQINTPIHQVDIVPTVASIAGVDGETTWLGKNILEAHPSGSPWIYFYRSEFHYRTAERACYSQSKNKLRCFDVQNDDPLFNANLKEIPVRPEESNFFKDVMQANMHSIALNLIAPPKHPEDDAIKAH